MHFSQIAFVNLPHFYFCSIRTEQTILIKKSSKRSHTQWSHDHKTPEWFCALMLNAELDTMQKQNKNKKKSSTKKSHWKITQKYLFTEMSFALYVCTYTRTHTSFARYRKDCNYSKAWHDKNPSALQWNYIRFFLDSLEHTELVWKISKLKPMQYRAETKYQHASFSDPKTLK